MPHVKKSQYTEKDERVIYALASPLSKNVYISHCNKKLIKDVFKQHNRGDRYKTKPLIDFLKKENLHPCLFILEEVFATKVEAYNYVVVWTKIFSEEGYLNLNHGNIEYYINDLSEKNYPLYEERKGINIHEKCNCTTCVVANYGRKICPLYNEVM